FSSRRRHTRSKRDWSSDVCSSDLLVLLNDHQAYYRHGWDAGPVVQRPHFDALARGGAVFERAYCAAPLCAPARRSLLTGLTPHQIGRASCRGSAYISTAETAATAR